MSNPTSTDLSFPADSTSKFASLLKTNDPLGVFRGTDCETLGNVIEQTEIPLRFAPLEVLPCANHHFEKNVFCRNPGKLPCNGCKNVKENINMFINCNNPSARSSSLATRVTEPEDHTGMLDGKQRLVELASLRNEIVTGTSTPTALSAILPAVDIVNLQKNEVDETRDFSLAFVAGGELRDIIRTVNGLGSDYTGHLNILLNNTSHLTVSRNIVLLLILGAIPNEAVAADIALHFWYSVFLPEEYRLRILAILGLVLQQYTNRAEPLSISLGQRSKLWCLVPREITDHLLYTAGPTLSTSQAREEYERNCTTSARLDSRNGMLEGVRPSHSLSFLEFWRSGVVLPFSAVREHHTASNASFFSPFGTWLDNRGEQPLASWDPNEVFKAGQAYGAQPEDVYGCLYFFLSDQLRTFAKRVRELRITFHVLSSVPQTLADGISSGEYSVYGLTPSIRFNRIAFANVFENRENMPVLLKSWAPLLAAGETAAMIGSFPDWADAQNDGRAVGADEEVIASVVRKLSMFGRLPPGTTLASAIAKESRILDAMYDTSKAFSKYLKTSGMSDAIRESKLKRRLKHKILPHRIRMPIDAKSVDLPHLPDDESWYRYVNLIKAPFSARYVELARSAP